MQTLAKFEEQMQDERIRKAYDYLADLQHISELAEAMYREGDQEPELAYAMWYGASKMYRIFTSEEIPTDRDLWNDYPNPGC